MFESFNKFIEEATDMNDPILIKMRAAQIKANKKAAERLENSKKELSPAKKNKVAKLKAEKEDLLSQMEREAGSNKDWSDDDANIYGDALNDIDQEIIKLGGNPLTESTINEDEVEDKLKDLFKNDPAPSDEKVHKLADSLGLSPHELEARIYKILGSFLNEANDKFIGYIEYAKGKKLEVTFPTRNAAELWSKKNADDILAQDGVESIGTMSRAEWDKKEAKYALESLVTENKSKGAKNYFEDLKFIYTKAFRYLDKDEKKEYIKLAKEYFSKVSESVINEAVEPQIQKIAELTGVAIDDVEKYVSSRALNITKLLQYIKDEKQVAIRGFEKAVRNDKKQDAYFIKMFNESVVNEAKSIAKIQKEWSNVIAMMKDAVADWKKAEGQEKSDLLDQLKVLTAAKKKLEAELDDVVGLTDVDAELTESKKVTLKRRYTENYPAITAGKAARIRNKILEAIKDGVITKEEFDVILSEMSSDSKRWVSRNAKYFNVSEEGVSLTKFGRRALSQVTVNEAYDGNIKDFKYEFEEYFEEVTGNSTKAIKKISKKGKGFEVRTATYMSQGELEDVGAEMGLELVSYKKDSNVVIALYENNNTDVEIEFIHESFESFINEDFKDVSDKFKKALDSLSDKKFTVKNIEELIKKHNEKRPDAAMAYAKKAYGWLIK